MTSISSPISLSNPNVRQIDTSKMQMKHVSELNEGSYQNYVKGTERLLEAQYGQTSDVSGHPAHQNYADVVVNGKVVAKVDNHGFVESSNAIGARVQGAITQADKAFGSQNGPMLAQARAEKIAEQMGGEVVKSSTALSQGQFQALPEVRVNTDRAAMKSDPMYIQLQKTKEARTMFQAQQIGQAGEYPLEYYQMPDWMVDFGATMLSTELGKPPQDVKVGASANAQGSPDDIEEYGAKIQEHFQAILKEAGVGNAKQYYEKVIADKDSSKAMNKQMLDRVQNDEELSALMDRLGISLPDDRA